MVIVNVKMPNYMKKQLTAIEDAINLEAIPKCEIKAAIQLDSLIGKAADNSFALALIAIPCVFVLAVLAAILVRCLIKS
jgi:hypothetical protein